MHVALVNCTRTSLILYLDNLEDDGVFSVCQKDKLLGR
jgi:hypothetical protein